MNNVCSCICFIFCMLDHPHAMYKTVSNITVLHFTVIPFLLSLLYESEIHLPHTTQNSTIIYLILHVTYPALFPQDHLGLISFSIV